MECRRIEQRCHGFLRRSVKKRSNDALQCGAAGGCPRHGGFIDISKPFLEMTDVALALQHAEDGAYRRIVRLIRETFLDFLPRGASAGEQNVHDLALAAAELGISRFLRYAH